MGLPRRGAEGLPCFESKRRAQQKSGLRGEARADVADELERRGCPVPLGVRMRGPVDAVLEDQVLLGERLGLAVVPGRAERGHRGPKLSALSASRGCGVRYGGLVRALYQTFLRKEAQTARDAVCAKSRQSLRTSSIKNIPRPRMEGPKRGLLITRNYRGNVFVPRARTKAAAAIGRPQAC